MYLSTTFRKMGGVIIFSVIALVSFHRAGAQSITPSISSFCTTQTFGTTGGSAVFWTASPSGIVQYGVTDRDGPTVELIAIGHGMITLTALVHVPSTFSYVNISKSIYVGGPTSPFTVEPLWFTENHNFCVNSFANNFHILSGSIPDITSFEWGISPATVLDANGWLQYTGMVFSSAGHYQVYVRAKNACGYGTSATQTYDLDAIDCLGGLSAAKPKPEFNVVPIVTAENIPKDLTVFPNPANSLVTVTIPPGLNLKRSFLRIVDLSGRQVKSVAGLTKYQVQVNIASLAPGNYVIEVSDADKRYTKKIIKK
jgi:hypothetical protein